MRHSAHTEQTDLDFVSVADIRGLHLHHHTLYVLTVLYIQFSTVSTPTLQLVVVLELTSPIMARPHAASLWPTVRVL